MLELKVSWDYILIGVKCSDFSRGSILSRTEFQQPDQLPKFITPEPLIVSPSVNNCWKEGKVFYDSCTHLLVRFSLEQSQNWNSWLLLAVKQELTSMPNIFVWCPVGRIKDDHFTWSSSSMRWCSSYIHEDYIKFCLFVFPWRSLMLP
jgi:hypothetical protein